MKFAELDAVQEVTGSNLLVVDSLNLCFRYKHSQNRNFTNDFISTVQSLAKSYNCSKIVILGDGGSTWRKEVYPEYKANRTKMRESQSKEDAQAFKEFFDAYTRCWDAVPFVKLRFDGVEADDIAAFISTKYTAGNVQLISSDRDWGLLVSPTCSQFSTVTRKEYTFDTFVEHNKVSIEQYISLKCLQGDSGDNVPGVPGIGPKRAEALLDEYGDVFEIMAAMPLPGTAKYIQNLNEFGVDNLERNFKLMSLLDFAEDNIGEQNCKTVLTTLRGL